jgi:hypothetical protein
MKFENGDSVALVRNDRRATITVASEEIQLYAVTFDDDGLDSWFKEADLRPLNQEERYDDLLWCKSSELAEMVIELEDELERLRASA